MKNLVRMGIEKLSTVPIQHLSDRPTQARKADWFGWERHEYKVGDYHPYTITRRTLEANIGKSFALAFSYYCKLVPKRDQKWFLEEFERNRNTEPSYIIDDNGNIQYNPNDPWRGWYKRRINNPKGLYTIESEDYKTELRHKITGHKKKDFEAIYENRRIYIDDNYLKYEHYHYLSRSYGKFLYFEYGGGRYNLKPINYRYTAQKSDFEPVIIQGWQKVFESKNDPEFKRIMAERRKRKILSRKKEMKEKAQKDYSFISQSEIQKKKEKELDKLKILAHGFDLVTSFRTEKQTNPDLIKLKQ